MSYALAMSACLVCRIPFMYNPRFVPSLKGEPVCRGCMELANAEREKMGLPPHPIHPEAYEPIDAAEL